MDEERYLELFGMSPEEIFSSQVLQRIWSLAEEKEQKGE